MSRYRGVLDPLACCDDQFGSLPSYERQQIDRVLREGTDEDHDHYRLQVVGKYGTKWLNATEEQVRKIKDVMDGLEPVPEDQELCDCGAYPVVHAASCSWVRL